MIPFRSRLRLAIFALLVTALLLMIAGVGVSWLLMLLGLFTVCILAGEFLGRL